MELELKQLINMHASLSKLVHQDLPIQIAFRLSRLAKQTQEIFTEFESSRSELVKKCDGSEEQFKTEIEKLLAEKISLDIQQVSVQDLEGAKLSPVDIINLNSFITG